VLPGVGTGLELPLLPPGVSAVGVDISPQMLNLATSRLGIDVTRPFGPMLAGSPACVLHQAAALHGLYRIILLERAR
jgi:hypothetical protein